jgi:hypothetical protein
LGSADHPALRGGVHSRPVMQGPIHSPTRDVQEIGNVLNSNVRGIRLGRRFGSAIRQSSTPHGCFLNTSRTS